MRANADPQAYLDKEAGAIKWVVHYSNPETFSGLSFICPCGCATEGWIQFKGDFETVGPRWSWDGNKDRPTLTPSVFNSGLPCKWHGWLRDGAWVEA